MLLERSRVITEIRQRFLEIKSFCTMDFMTVTLYSPFMPQLYELMRSAAAASAAVVVDTADHLHQNPDFPIIVAAVCGVWYVFIVAVQTIGTIQLYDP